MAFTGFLVALLILSPEGLGALKAVLNNQVQRAMNLFFGSVLATISLTVPVVTLIAFMTGNDLQFALGAPEMIVMVASLLLCQISFSTGRTNVLNGAAHMALFVAYLMTILRDVVGRVTVALATLARVRFVPGKRRHKWRRQRGCASAPVRASGDRCGCALCAPDRKIPP